MYSKGGAVAANPYTLRAITNQSAGLTPRMARMPGSSAEADADARALGDRRKREALGPPRASFKVLNAGASAAPQRQVGGGGALTLTLSSLRS